MKHWKQSILMYSTLKKRVCGSVGIAPRGWISSMCHTIDFFLMWSQCLWLCPNNTDFQVCSSTLKRYGAILLNSREAHYRGVSLFFLPSVFRASPVLLCVQAGSHVRLRTSLQMETFGCCHAAMAVLWTVSAECRLENKDRPLHNSNST